MLFFRAKKLERRMTCLWLNHMRMTSRNWKGRLKRLKNQREKRNTDGKLIKYGRKLSNFKTKIIKQFSVVGIISSNDARNSSRERSFLWTVYYLYIPLVILNISTDCLKSRMISEQSYSRLQENSILRSHFKRVCMKMFSRLFIMRSRIKSVLVRLRLMQKKFISHMTHQK